MATPSAEQPTSETADPLPKYAQPAWAYCPARHSHSFIRHGPHQPGSLVYPIARDERVDHVPAIETEPALVLPCMLVMKMHGNDEPEAAFTSHVTPAISLGLLDWRHALFQEPIRLFNRAPYLFGSGTSSTPFGSTPHIRHVSLHTSSIIPEPGQHSHRQLFMTAQEGAPHKSRQSPISTAAS